MSGGSGGGGFSEVKSMSGGSGGGGFNEVKTMSGGSGGGGGGFSEVNEYLAESFI